jgi:hypothetical protein
MMLSNFPVAEVKQIQYCLLAKAGLAVSEGLETSIPNLHKNIYIEFKEAINAFQLPENLKGLDKNILFRSRNFPSKPDVIKPDDLRTGMSLWRKWGEIKRVVVNEFSPLLAGLMKNGDLPSGKSMAELLKNVRKMLFEASEERALKNSKSSKGYAKKPFLETWFPPEWDVFTTYGTASSSPEGVFMIR